ncbi:UDP-3-O-[3-hydroxymyristoyl] N-acetylglucosamine deacetylase [bacterium]|nr:UDP-3-O-[3-hydroxymyristoyl] N-acetylglucosamine deacetylase [bacterium]
MRRRGTLDQPITFSGVGIHSGQNCTLTISPAEVYTGIVFRRRMNSADYDIPASVYFSRHQNRATRLESNDAKVMTPEHLLAALFGTGITDAIIGLDSDEVPILDGSSAQYCDSIIAAGHTPFDVVYSQTVVKTPQIVSRGDSSVLALPCDDLAFSMILTYDNFIGTQSVTWTFDTTSFTTEIAPARTYAFQSEIDQLLAAGLGKGGSLENAIVIGDTEFITPLRFPDELARHKLLDLIGDLSLVGTDLKGHFVGIRSGHSLNREMALKLARLGTNT